MTVLPEEWTPAGPTVPAARQPRPKRSSTRLDAGRLWRGVAWTTVAFWVLYVPMCLLLSSRAFPQLLPEQAIGYGLLFAWFGLTISMPAVLVAATTYGPLLAFLLDLGLRRVPQRWVHVLAQGVSGAVVGSATIGILLGCFALSTTSPSPFTWDVLEVLWPPALVTGLSAAWGTWMATRRGAR